MKKIVLFGAGRMGQRHLLGLANFSGHVDIVDPLVGKLQDLINKQALDHHFHFQYHFHSSVDELEKNGMYDAAIFASPASNRLDLFRWAARNGIKKILTEKSLEQSRVKVRELCDLAKHHQMQVCCNLYRRFLPFYKKYRERITTTRKPVQIVVNSGASGLACNGIHWIDFAMYLTNSKRARLLHGEIQASEIASGRGPQYRDYGGIGIYELEHGSRLILNMTATSSAATSCTIIEESRCTWIDQSVDHAIIHERRADSTKPMYLYGQDYERNQQDGIESISLPELTAAWLEWAEGQRKECDLPDLYEAAIVQEALFDLLETSGELEFKII